MPAEPNNKQPEGNKIKDDKIGKPPDGEPISPNEIKGSEDGDEATKKPNKTFGDVIAEELSKIIQLGPERAQEFNRLQEENTKLAKNLTSKEWEIGRQNRPNWWLVALTGFLVLSGLIGNAITYVQVQNAKEATDSSNTNTRRSLDIAERQTVSAEKAVETANRQLEIMKTDLKADISLSFDDPKRMMNPNDSTWKIKLVYRNNGKTAAKKVQISWRFPTNAKEMESMFQKSKKEIPVFGQDVPAGNSGVTDPEVLVKEIVFTEEQELAIQNKTFKFYMLCYISYYDIFGQVRHTTLGMFRPQDKPYITIDFRYDFKD